MILLKLIKKSLLKNTMVFEEAFLFSKSLYFVLYKKEVVLLPDFERDTRQFTSGFVWAFYFDIIKIIDASDFGFLQ